MAARPPPSGQYLPMPPHQQPPQGMPMPGQVPIAPASNNNTIIIIVVVAIVAVVLVVAIVIPMLLYVSVAGLGPGNAPQNVTMVVQGSNVAGNFSFSVSS